MATPVEEPRWTADDVVAYLRLASVETLYTWRKRSYGPVGRRVGRHLLYDPDEVRAWFRDQKAA